MTDPKAIEVLVPEDDLMAAIDDLADRLAPRLTGDWAAVCILVGATLFTSDLLKALARRDIHPMLDSLWLESYRDARESSGRVSVRADLSRPVQGKGVLLIDDVYDTGRTLAYAREHVLAKGAREVVCAALAKKPPAPKDGIEFWALDLPDRFLVGYGMDDRGLYRGLPFIGALD